MHLFEHSEATNILPEDGEVFYIPQFISIKDATHYTQALLQQIPWQHDEVIIYGKKIITKRKVAWYADNNLPYKYSNTVKEALPWDKTLLALKTLVEQYAHVHFNACLLNLYHNGTEGMGWHSDNEKELLHNGCIASLSFGADRKFMFKHKATKHTLSLNLQSGSLLLMKGATQQHWQHQLAKTTKQPHPRINLTFRIMNT